MSYKVRTTADFDRDAKRLAKKYKSLKDDLAKFFQELTDGKEMGVELSPNIRKHRLAIQSKGKGKSGGARVISFEVCTTEIDQSLVLLTIYDKSEQASISDKAIRQLIQREGL